MDDARDIDKILYVDGHSMHCAGAIKCADRKVHIQDVAHLNRPLPHWLIGVPTLVMIDSGDVYRGRHCQEVLQKSIGDADDADDVEDKTPYMAVRSTKTPEAVKEVNDSTMVTTDDIEAYLAAR